MPARWRTARTTDVNLRSGPQGREYDAIVGRIVADRPGRILDWGCGHGQIADRLRRRGIDVTAHDYDPTLAEPVVRPLERYPEIPVHLSPDPVRLPFDDGRFDSVLSLGVLEHVAQPEDSLRELARVLVPGGRLYVYKLPNERSYLEWIARRAGLYYHGSLPDDRLYTLDGARRILEDAGYVVDEIRLANMLPLTVPGQAVERFGGALWGANRALARVPVLNGLATNVEAVARRP